MEKLSGSLSEHKSGNAFQKRVPDKLFRTRFRNRLPETLGTVFHKGVPFFYPAKCSSNMFRKTCPGKLYRKCFKIGYEQVVRDHFPGQFSGFGFHGQLVRDNVRTSGPEKQRTSCPERFFWKPRTCYNNSPTKLWSFISPCPNHFEKNPTICWSLFGQILVIFRQCFDDL